MTAKKTVKAMHDEAIKALDYRAFKWHRQKDEKTEDQQAHYKAVSFGMAVAYMNLDLISDAEYNNFMETFVDGAEYMPHWYLVD